MSSENEELLYWLEQEPITNTDAFLAPDTPTAPSRSIINTRLENGQKKHERIVERLINQQTWALSDFQAAFAERIDQNLFQTKQDKKLGFFETISGERFLVEKQKEIMDILDELQNVIEKGETQSNISPENLCAQRLSDPVDPFTNQIKVVYESELQVLRDRQKALFEDFQHDYIEEKMPLQQQLAQFEPTATTLTPSSQAQAKSPILSTLPSSIPAKRVETKAQSPPPTSTKRIRFSSPHVQSEQEPTRSQTNTSVTKSTTSHTQLPSGLPNSNRSSPRDPRIRGEQAPQRPTLIATPKRSVIQKVKAGVATPIATPISAPSKYHNIPTPSKPANAGGMPPEVVSSSPTVAVSAASTSRQHKNKTTSKGFNAPLLDRGTMDMVGPDVFFIEKQSKTRIHLGVAKDFDNALHDPRENSPIFVRTMQNERWFYRRRDQARIGLVSKIEPMIRNYLLQT